MSHYLRNIVDTFTPDARQCLDAAVSEAVSRGHHEVKVEHLLLATLSVQPALAEQLCLRAGLAGDRLLEALQQDLDRLPRGGGKPVLSTELVQFLEKASLHANLCWRQKTLPASAFLAGALTANQHNPFALSSRSYEALSCDSEVADSLLAAAQDAEQAEEPRTAQSDPVLAKYTHNLTEQARAGRLDPVLGRENEICQMIDILLRRRQNNPVLTGEPGVGKTALVEGLAQRIVAGSVPDSLKETAVLTLDLALLQAGASVKGEFENRLQGVLKAVQASPTPAILFIDEAHMLIGSGGQAGQNDAANLLKPALARGEIRLIGATTWAEYKKYFEKDAALARRFQRVKVEEPDRKTAIAMLRALAKKISEHHGMPIPDSAVVTAVDLSQRYVSDRQLPDKAITLLDTACARAALSQHQEPQEIALLKTQLAWLAAERQGMAEENDHDPRLQKLAQREQEAGRQLERLTPEWQAQRRLVSQIRQSQNRQEQNRLRTELARQHRERTLVFERADPWCVAEVVTDWTGVPVKNRLEKEAQQLNTLYERLAARVIGQTHVQRPIVEQIRISRAGLSDEHKPTGVFMLAGPSGVGKTETALALADLLYGGRRSLITINMSEYQEAHSVAGLKGAPPGYVGYGQGGILTEAVRRQPWSVILLDEAEKAHPDVMELFYQVFDKGQLEDSEGQKVDFRHTLILLTSNLGSEKLLATSQEGEADVDALAALIRPEFERVFRPALMGRLLLLPYLPLNREAIGKIIRLKLQKVCERFRGGEDLNRSLSYSASVVSYLAQRCHISQSGARDIDAVIAKELLPLLADSIIAVDSDAPLHLRVGVAKKQLTLAAGAAK